MQHICTSCLYCFKNKACRECCLREAYDIFETTGESSTKNQLNLYGLQELATYPFEVEQISEFNIRVSHPYFNCSELNLMPLLQVLTAAHKKEIDMDKDVSRKMLDLTIELLCREGVTIKDLGTRLSEPPAHTTLDIYIYDARFSHLLTYEALFRHFSQGELFIADIHDLTHHGLQMIVFSDFVPKLGQFGLQAIQNKSEYQLELAIFLLYACLEYSIIKGSRNAYSGGCLNWQHPRKSPAENAQYQPMCAKCIVSWNSVRGLTSLYRREKQSADKLGIEVEWMKKLGYDTYPENPITGDITFRKDIFVRPPLFSGPHTIEALLENATILMKEERSYI